MTSRSSKISYLKRKSATSQTLQKNPILIDITITSNFGF